MLKGILIAATGTEELKKCLEREGLPWAERGDPTREGFCRALAALGAEKDEVLCLVETDEEEKEALSIGLFCIGYLNPLLDGQKLSGCRLLLEGFEEVDVTFLRNVHTRAMGLPVRIAETSRLLIREMTLEDLDEVDALYQEDSSAFLLSGQFMERKEEEEKIKAYITYMYGLYQFGMWVVIEKESKKLIGRAGFGIADYLGAAEVDLGYLIGKAYRRRGYGEEACRAVLAYAKTVLAFRQVSAYIEGNNSGSLALIEKLGFEKAEDFLYEGRKLHRYLLKFGGK